MRTRLLSALLVSSSLLLASATAHARRGPRPALERAGDKRELRQDQRQIADDRFDLARLEALQGRFDQARAGGDAAALARIEDELRAVVRGELAEGRREMKQDQAEIRGDRRELRGERAEVRGDVAAGRPLAAAGDRRDVRDDKRDLRDDKRDLAVEAGQQARRRAIAEELRGLDNRLDPASLDRKRALIAELIGLARAELAGDRQEKREDKRELREDRRERRERR